MSFAAWLSYWRSPQVSVESWWCNCGVHPFKGGSLWISAYPDSTWWQATSDQTKSMPSQALGSFNRFILCWISFFIMLFASVCLNAGRYKQSMVREWKTSFPQMNSAILYRGHFPRVQESTCLTWILLSVKRQFCNDVNMAEEEKRWKQQQQWYEAYDEDDEPSSGV